MNVINKSECCKYRKEVIINALLGKNNEYIFKNVPEETLKKWIGCLKTDQDCSECESLLDKISEQKIKQEYGNCCNYRRKIFIKKYFGNEINMDEAKKILVEFESKPLKEWIGFYAILLEFRRVFGTDKCLYCQEVRFLADNLATNDKGQSFYGE